MKKLLLMVPMLHQGGFERVCVKTARVLQGLYDVTIVIFSDKDINYDIDGLHVVNINVPTTKGKLGKAVNVLKRVQKVHALKKAEHYDYAYSFGSSANLVNVFSGAGEEILTGLRCQTDLESPRQVRLFCKRSSRVLSCSREIMRQLDADFDYQRSCYIYNPLDIEDIEEKAKEIPSDFPFPKDLEQDEHHLIISMGRDDYIKGNWHLVKAFSLVKKEIPDAKLMIFGAGSYEGNKKLAKDLGLSDSVAFPGNRKNPFAYVSKADLYVLPSNHEGFPNALLEAMAMKKPVVAADCKTGPREILFTKEEYEALLRKQPDGSSITEVTDATYGVLVPDMDQTINNDASVITEDDKRLAQAILSVLGSKDRMQHYSEKAYERAKCYAPEKYKDALIDVLEQQK